MRFSRVFSIEIFFSQPFLPEISPSFILNEISALSQMRFLHGLKICDYLNSNFNFFYINLGFKVGLPQNTIDKKIVSIIFSNM
jgi:hypothetical protein